MTNVPSVPSDKRAAIDAVLKKIRSPVTDAVPGTRGRLLFPIDATASRQELWDLACKLQAEMFVEVAMIGGLDMQVCFYRGHHEWGCSPWASDARTLTAFMEQVHTSSGHTQIARVLQHAREENARQKLSAVVFVGDCVEETPADLYAAAGKLAVPVFLFQEGDDPQAAEVFKEVARLTKGVHCPFDPGSAKQLGELLRAVARYAAGGKQALLQSGGAGAVKLLQQLSEEGGRWPILARSSGRTRHSILGSVASMLHRAAITAMPKHKTTIANGPANGVHTASAGAPP